MNSLRKLLWSVLVAGSTLLMASGCGGTSDKIVAASGKVTHNGQPVPGIILSFVPQGPNESGVSSGKSDESGRFKLTLASSGRSGAVAGSHKVWVSLPLTVHTEDTIDAEGKRKKGKDRPKAEKPTGDLQMIIKKYGSLEKTPLQIEVNGSELEVKLD